ncbi:MAG: glycosyltransferase family 4 protein [Capsulimonadales bacterium]|nr:glycosyltransferase family 4 protein [Capsulimonadales bacterium]
MGENKILFVSNTGWYLYNFRLPLARAVRSAGMEVVMVAPRDEYVSRLETDGFRWVELPLERRSINPVREAGVVGTLAGIIRRERPVALHNFTIKCVLYGSMTGNLCGVPSIINALPGLGQVYTGRSWKTRALRAVVDRLYRTLLTRRNTQVIFQNPDDLREFADARLIVPERCHLIRSSGVDIERFRPDPNADPARLGETPVIFTAARLTHAKGIYELVDAARRLRKRGVAARFLLAGEIDHGNPTAIPQTALEEWQKEGIVELLGHVEGMEDYLRRSTLAVLPSYREGVPRTLTEAAAMGKPIVTTDAPGCREIVDHEMNGLKVPVRDSEALANAIERLLGDPELRERMGKASRQKAVAEFDERDVIRRTLEVYRAMGVLPPAARESERRRATKETWAENRA